MKKIFIDVETGGTDHKQNPLLQLSGCVEIDGEEKEFFDHLLKPFDGQIIEDKALEVTGFTREQIATFSDPRTVYNEFLEMLDRHIDKFDKKDKAFFIGYNSRFDEDFLRGFFINNAVTEKDKEFGNYYGSYFWTPSVDVMQLAIFALAKERPSLDNFKLQTVCGYLGYDVANTDWHDAKADIAATKWLFSTAYRKLSTR